MKKKRLIPVYLAVILSVVLAGQTVCFAGMSFDSAVSADELIKEKLSIRRGIIEETVEYSEDEEPFYEEEEEHFEDDGWYDFADEEDEINAVCYDEEDEDYDIEEDEEDIVEPIIEEPEEEPEEETNPLKGNEVAFCTTVSVNLGEPKDARFTFQLLNEDLEVLDEAQNDESGFVEFKDQLIEEAGTYFFFISGVNDLAGYIYDDHTERIVVVVTEEYIEVMFDDDTFQYFTYEFVEECPIEEYVEEPSEYMTGAIEEYLIEAGLTDWVDVPDE